MDLENQIKQTQRNKLQQPPKAFQTFEADRKKVWTCYSRPPRIQSPKENGDQPHPRKKKKKLSLWKASHTDPICGFSLLFPSQTKHTQPHFSRMLKTERGQNKLKGRKPLKTPSGKKLQIS